MPKNDSNLLDNPSIQEDSLVNSRTRIDRAHVVARADAEEAGKTPWEALAADDSELAAEQLHGQADQLAAYLRSRQRDLDQRESRLNARMAQLDTSARHARMILNQEQADLVQRESVLAEQEKEVETRLARLASTEAVAGRLRDQFAEERTRHEEMQKEMDAERTTLAAVQKEQADKEEALRHERQQIDRHREASLQSIVDRQKVQQEAQSHSEQAAARHARAAMELEKKRDSLRRRSERVDHSRAALLKLRSELGRMHRETLEIGLATEELWSQMSGTATPTALSRSLERIRAQLAGQYKTAATELTEQKQELHAIRSELSRQHEQLLERKQELQRWAKRREEAFERQTARLVAREEELGSRQPALDDLVQQWHGEQLDDQAEIRRLQARLDESTRATVTA